MIKVENILNYYQKNICKFNCLAENYVFNELCGEKLYFFYEKEKNISHLQFGGKVCLLSSVVALLLIDLLPFSFQLSNVQEIYNELSNVLQEKKVSMKYLQLDWFRDLRDKRRIKCLTLPFRVFML